MESVRRVVILGAAVALGAMVGALPAVADTPPPPAPPAITWIAPSPAGGATVPASIGQVTTIAVAAADTVPGSTVHISSTGLPAGALLANQDTNPGAATLTWTPAAGQSGPVTITFTATDAAVPPTPAASLTVTIDVAAPAPPPPPPPPTRVVLTTSTISHWAFVLRRVVARAAPSPTAHAVATVSTSTSDGTSNILSLLEQQQTSSGVWVRARLAILPNNSTGWVPRSALSSYTTVRTHLYVDRSLHLLVLKRDGRAIFRTQVGVGKPYWPTPAGEFYLRDKLIDFNNPFYGPIAFGTSARSAVLTDWPGGGYVGVHGTNEPDLIPGAISHGCIRLRNDAIVKLASLLSVGTPLTVT